MINTYCAYLFYSWFLHCGFQREKEALHKKIIDLEKQIDQRQALELEIEQLKGAAQVVEHMGRDNETKKRMEDINKQLKEKEEELEDVEDLTQALVVKERKCNDELQDARKELITVSVFSFNFF